MTLMMTLILATLVQDDWTPTKETVPLKGLVDVGRTTDVYRHGVRKEWGYKAPQQDTFIVVHPKADRKNAPLYVVLHSAGHAVVSCVNCTTTVGNHDIYRAPEDFYALYLDCAANRGDWWWGGMSAGDAGLIKKNSGPDPMPVERRVIDCVKWVIKTYEIDPNRVYLSGNSMGGSGTLGIGLRNGDVFAAIKANVPAGIEHAAHRMGFPPQPMPEGVVLPDPPVVVDYSAPNDGWSFGHDRFVKAMNDRKYALYFYWGPFGHANNSAQIKTVNDLIDSFDWLSVKKNEAYAVFTNASCNQPLPWPDKLKEKAAGQVNAFFRWKTVEDAANRVEVSLFLTSPDTLKTAFEQPRTATADVSLRRLQAFAGKAGDAFHWTFGSRTGEGKVDAAGVITVPGLELTPAPVSLVVSK